MAFKTAQALVPAVLSQPDLSWDKMPSTSPRNARMPLAAKVDAWRRITEWLPKSMRLAHRIEKLPAYLFAEISRKIAEKRAQGVDVISFAIGDPDLPTPDHILDALAEAARDTGEPPLSGERGPAGAARGDRTLVRAALRRGARPADGSPAADRLEGGHRAHRVLLHRPRRRRAGAGPGLPGVRASARACGRRAVLPAADRRERLPAGPRRRAGADRPAGEGALAELPEQPDRRRRRPRRSSSAPSHSRSDTTSRCCTTARTPRSRSTATSR